MIRTGREGLSAQRTSKSVSVEIWSANRTMSRSGIFAWRALARERGVIGAASDAQEGREEAENGEWWEKAVRARGHLQQRDVRPAGRTLALGRAAWVGGKRNGWSGRAAAMVTAYDTNWVRLRNRGQSSARQSASHQWKASQQSA